MTQYKTRLFIVHIAVLDRYVGCWSNSLSLSHLRAQVLFVCASTNPEGLIII